jgi:hypothetical protein
VRLHLLDVGLESGELVGDRVERVPRGVDAGGRADLRLELRLVELRHRAGGVRDDQDPVDAEQVHAQHERLHGLLVDPTTGVAEDLGVARLQAQEAERVDARVHAGHDGHTGLRDTIEAGEREVGGVRLVGSEKIVEVTHGGEVSPPGVTTG